ncbi:MAG: TolC family protein [Bacteroidetes bacterium]|nr:TolC family protein [Bacteroidota bacterium]
MAFLLPPVLGFGQLRDTTYFNPLIDEITQRIPPLEDLIDSAIVHNPQIKYYEADISAWRYRVKSASRVWMRNFYLEGYLQTDWWDATTNNASNLGDNNIMYSFQNSYRGLGQLEIRLPMQDLWDRKNQMKTATKEIEKSMANKDNVILELRQKIITQYNQLSVNQKILKNANESVIAGAMNKEMGDKEFLNGQSTLYDLAYIMEMYRVAVYNYETSRNAFFNSYMILQELCGFKFNVINKIE